jgi:hypothetical protein
LAPESAVPPGRQAWSFSVSRRIRYNGRRIPHRHENF